MKNQNGNGKLIAGLILGAVSGAALGVLFAPSDGQNTRKKISKDIEKFGNDVANKFNHEAEVFKNKANNILASTEEKAEYLARQAEQGINKADKFSNSLKSEANDKAQQLTK